MLERRLGHSRLVIPAALGVLAWLGATEACAQAVERNLPPLPPSAPEVPIAPPAPRPEDDAKPIGPNLSALVFVDGSGKINPSAKPLRRIDLDRLARLKGKERGFEGFLGRPISRKLVSQIEAKALAIYRSAGHPFINISTPPQDITDGVLQIRIVEYNVGAVKLTNVGPGDRTYIENRVRLTPGGQIDAIALAEDLDWLNRYEFRKLTAVFTPSSLPGDTDVTLQASPSKPWSVSVGFANSGSPLTGEDRYFVVAQAALPLLHDAVVSYQGTVSEDGLFQHGEPFSGAGDAQYESNALRLIVPTLPRQSLEITFNEVKTNQPLQVFVSKASILEASVAYRTALSNLSRLLAGDFTFGIEAKQDTSTLLFGGEAIQRATIAVDQLLVGYNWQGASPLGATQLGVSLHISPGGIGAANTNLAFASFSADQFNSARYTYGAAQISNLSPPLAGIAWLSGLRLSNALMVQYSDKPLPVTEQMGLGGVSLVRGYTLDDGAFDSAAILRNELRLLPTSVFHRGDTLAPYLFADVGYAKLQAARQSGTAASVGAGLDYTLAQRAALSLDIADALLALGNTRRGAARADVRISVNF